MKWRVSLVATLAWFGIAMSGYAQNLLQNPGCETAGNPPPSWVQVSGNWSCNTFLPPQEGAAHFYPGAVAIGELQQDISVSSSAVSIDLGLATASFTGYVQSFPQTPPDLSRIIVEYRDTTNTVVLSSFDSGDIGSVGAWQQVTDARAIPVGTRTIRVRLVSTRQAGSDNDGYYDGLSLTVNAPLPPPLTIPTLSEWGLILLVLLLAGAAVTQIRKPA